MTSFANIRDPKQDTLLTPENAVVIIIDYQPVQVSSVASRDKRELAAPDRASGGLTPPCVAWVSAFRRVWSLA